MDYDDKLSSKCFTSIVNPSKTLANRSRISYNPLLELRMLVTIFKNFLEELKQRRRLNNFRWCCLCFFLFEFSPFHVIFASVFFQKVWIYDISFCSKKKHEWLCLSFDWKPIFIDGKEASESDARKKQLLYVLLLSASLRSRIFPSISNVVEELRSMFTS